MFAFDEALASPIADYAFDIFNALGFAKHTGFLSGS
jgi:hypothetical protein